MEYRRLMLDTGDPQERIVCDYISSMSDRYAIGVYSDLFIPSSWAVK